MNENLQELKQILSLLYERRQIYIDLVKEPMVDFSDEIHFIPDNEILKNIEKLIDLVNESIQEHISSFGKNDIIEPIKSLKKFIAN
jgi:hypothetical protein